MGKKTRKMDASTGKKNLDFDEERALMDKLNKTRFL
jgi:hypothetical protein